MKIKLSSMIIIGILLGILCNLCIPNLIDEYIWYQRIHNHFSSISYYEDQSGEQEYDYIRVDDQGIITRMVGDDKLTYEAKAVYLVPYYPEDGLDNENMYITTELGKVFYEHLFPTYMRLETKEVGEVTVRISNSYVVNNYYNPLLDTNYVILIPYETFKTIKSDLNHSVSFNSTTGLIGKDLLTKEYQSYENSHRMEIIAELGGILGLYVIEVILLIYYKYDNYYYIPLEISTFLIGFIVLLIMNKGFDATIHCTYIGIWIIQLILTVIIKMIYKLKKPV